MKVALCIVLIMSLVLIVTGIIVPWFVCSGESLAYRMFLTCLAVPPGVAFTTVAIEEIKENYWR